MKFRVHTYGCQMNVRDSEAIEALMIAAGFEKSAGEDDADVVIVNSCTVREKAEEKAIGKAGNLVAAGKIAGLAGCAVQRLGEKVFKRLPGLDFAVGPRAIGLIPKIVADGRYPRLELGDEGMGAALSSHVEGGWRSFVTVLAGCDNRCSYCIVPDVRGHEYSRPAAEIVAEISALARRGVKEVCLLGQSVLRYGRRNAAWPADAPSGPAGFSEPFPRLLEAVSAIDGIERIRFTSAYPKGCTAELVRAFREFPKVCRHLHLPVQSGSDRVLASMGRGYTRAEYLEAVAALRSFDPEFAVTTDVIVGYPGETEEDFEATRSLMDEAGFDNSFIFKYSPRPGTRSAAMPDDVPKEEKERRDQVLLADQERRGLERNSRLCGTVRRVLCEGRSKRNAGRLSGRDSGNRIVVWDGEPGSMRDGEAVDVRITGALAQTLVGEAVTPA
ncbi:MAG: tRNA (N6-isopentenyl adenosine(37)-C2)-methylthiotransferase MiaB [Kiritimatiellae bacterium]|nr:tRNA (N6-isopentenyl adenosine(37)-C2)-methylthiotransferase MiaB [Kiritimatiellia bacterium]